MHLPLRLRSAVRLRVGSARSAGLRVVFGPVPLLLLLVLLLVLLVLLVLAVVRHEPLVVLHSLRGGRGVASGPPKTAPSSPRLKLSIIRNSCNTIIIFKI